MKKSLLRAFVAAVVVGPVALVGFWFMFADGPPPAGGPMPPIVPVIIALVLATVASVIAAGVTFVFSQYPASARVATIFATGACLLLSGFGIYDDMHHGKPLEISSHLGIWLLLWPICFTASLWVDLKRALAKKIVEGMKKKGSSPIDGAVQQGVAADERVRFTKPPARS
jgi:hypothetical protein